MRQQIDWPVFGRLTLTVLRLRWVLLPIVVVLTVPLALEIWSIRIDSSNEAWLVEGDSTLALQESFNERFGNDDFVYVLHDAGDVFRAETIRSLDALANELEGRVPHVYDMTWLGNAEWIEGREHSIEIEPLMDPLPQEPEALALVREIALSEPDFINNLISPDGSVAGVMLEMESYPEDAVDPRKDVTPVVREILASPAYADLETVVVGGPILDHDLDILSASEGLRLGVYCLIIQMIILAWVGRGVRSVVVPALVVVLSTTWTFGVIGSAGLTLNAAAIMVPALLICVGIGDSMHLISEFNQQTRQGLARRDALQATMTRVAWPCVLTSVTTSAGFLAFMTADVKPFQDMGKYAALGVVLALLLSFVLVPILYSLGRDHAPHAVPASSTPDIFDRILRGISRFVIAHPRGLVATFMLLLVVSAVGYTRIQIETSPVRMFRQGVPVRDHIEWADERMGGGSMSLELMIDTGREGGVLEPELLRELDALDRFVSRHEFAVKTTSYLDVLRKMRRAFNENQESFYDIPTTRSEAAQYLLLYDMSGGEDREKLLTSNEDVARFSVRTRSIDTRDARQLMSDIRSFIDANFRSEVRVDFTGTTAWMRSMTSLVNRGQTRSFAAALVAISILMVLVLRSVRLGLISMIPNVFPVLITLGFLGWAGIYMDIMMMSFSALILGVAVDDTIHFFVRYRSEFDRTGRYAEALEATLTSVGRPITFTTLTLSLGFAALTGSQVVGIGHFGIFSGYAFVWALVADFFFAPALLLLLKPLGPERLAGLKGAS